VTAGTFACELIVHVVPSLPYALTTKVACPELKGRIRCAASSTLHAAYLQKGLSDHRLHLSPVLANSCAGMLHTAGQLFRQSPQGCSDPPNAVQISNAGKSSRKARLHWLEAFHPQVQLVPASQDDCSLGFLHSANPR
jgi:hypothetical protein